MVSPFLFGLEIAMRVSVVLMVLALSIPSTSTAGQPTVVFLSEWEVLGGNFVPFDGPFDVACASDGTVLVSDLTKVQRFTGAGVALGQWFLGPVGINPHGTPGLMAINDQDIAYMPAGFGYVQKLTMSGTLLAQWRGQQTTTGSNAQFFGVAVGSDGSVFLGDATNRNIQKFTPDGQFLSRWTMAGDGQPLAPAGIAADRTGRIYVLNQYGGTLRVDVFDLNGNSIFHFGSTGTEDGQFQAVTDIAIGASGQVFISDERLRRVQEFGPDGSFTGVVGSQGTADGQFNLPAGIGTDGLGNLFVADIFGKLVPKFGPAATPAELTTWGRVKANYRGL